MAKVDPYDSEYQAVSITIVERLVGGLPFDIFIKRAEGKFTRLFSRGDETDPSRLKRYQVAKGVESLYVGRDDYKIYLLFAEQVGARLLKKDSEATVDELIEVTREMVNHTAMEIIMRHNLNPITVQAAAQTAAACVKLMARDRMAFAKLLKSMGEHPYRIKHALGTTTFALMLARADGIKSEKPLTNLGLGTLVLDVGMSLLSFEPETKTELTADEWKEVKQHPELGKRLLDQSREFPTEVKMLVMHHHEQPNGNGYPNNLHDSQIYYPAKIAAIADSFAALVSARPYRTEPYSAFRAIGIMRESHGKFDTRLLDLFASFFIHTSDPK
ncbi:MAG: HD domain-containing phosphohydrolase [Bdellovibrionota bacterium]